MKTEKKRTLKGSVLFTVISVLTLMIIFMTSALALAAAANKRAHKTYSSSQATYTARSTIDAILAAVGTDNEFAKAVDNIASGGSISVDVDINDPSLGRIDKATVSFGGTTKIYDPDAQRWVDKNILNITAEVTLGGETSTIVSHVIQDPIIKSEDGPGYLSMGGDTFETNQKSVWGGAYYGMGYGPGGTVGSWASMTYYDYCADPGFESTIRLEDKKYLTNVTYAASTGTNYMEAPLVYNGNCKISAQQHVVFTQLGKGLQVWGDLLCENPGGFDVSANLDSAAKSLKFTQMPYVYVDGEFNPSGGDFKLGTKNTPFNLFCGSLQNVDKKGNTFVYGDMYFMDADATSNLYMTGTSNLYAWGDSVVNKTDAYSSSGGNVFSKGSVVLGSGNKNDLVVAGDLRVEGDLTISKEFTLDVKGDLVVGGKLTNNGEIKVKSENLYVNMGTGNKFDGVTAELKEGVDVKKVPEYKIKKYHVLKNTKVEYFYDPNNPVGQIQEKGTWWVPDELVKKYNIPSKEENMYGIKMDVYDGSTIKINSADEQLLIKGIYSEGDVTAYTNEVTCYYKDGKQISESNAYTYKGKTKYDGKDVKSASDYKKNKGTIYPEYAEKHNLLGIMAPVKGIEGRIAKDYSVTVPADAKVYNGSKDPIEVTETCTLTGNFSGDVTVKAADKDIKVLIKDASFTGNARIKVKEEGKGKVSFGISGDVSCDYNNKKDKDDMQVVMTVYECMNTWGIEANVQTPPPIAKPNWIDKSDVVAHDAADAENKVHYKDNTKKTVVVPASSDMIDVCLTGEWADNDKVQTIEIEPLSSGDRWIMLDNFTYNQADKFTIRVKDMKDGKQINGNVNFFINHDNAFKKFYLTTDSFEADVEAAGKGEKRQAYTDPAKKVKDVKEVSQPHVNVYSPVADRDIKFEDSNFSYKFVKDSTLTCSNGGFICGNVRAPMLAVKSDDSWGDGENFYNTFLKNFYYNGELLDKANRLGIVGCLNVKSLASKNDWTLIYLKQSSGGSSGSAVTGANGKHKYASVDYATY